MTDSKLSLIIKAIEDGNNVLLHGSGGCGKTYTLRSLASHFQSKGKTVACTATTGVAAINLNIPEEQIMGRTLHSWAGIKLGRPPAEKLYAQVYQKKGYRDRWKNVDILIIDEISMLGASLIEKLDYIARKIRAPPRMLKGEISKPFGGIQLILSGDFLQLPPVKEVWCFKSKVWDSWNLHPFIFSEPKRYDDLRYFNLLSRVRRGEQTQEDINLLRRRVKAYDRLQEIIEKSKTSILIRPTILFSRKKDVRAYNERELNNLKSPPHDFIAIDSFTPFNKGVKRHSYISHLDDAIPESIILRVGAQVMLKANLDISAGLVNGSRGVITEILNEGEPVVVVKFLNGKNLRMQRHTWTIEDKNGFASRTQFPLILAYACTIHKGQGSTLDYAVCDLGPSLFTEGQAYVALSRVRNLKSLFITELYAPRIEANEDALEFEDRISKS